MGYSREVWERLILTVVSIVIHRERSYIHTHTHVASYLHVSLSGNVVLEILDGAHQERNVEGQHLTTGDGTEKGVTFECRYVVMLNLVAGMLSC